VDEVMERYMTEFGGASSETDVTLAY
jgi:hypothetical protein